VANNKNVDTNQLYDIRVARLPVSDAKDTRIVARRILEAQNLQEKVTSCVDLQKQTKVMTDLTIKSMDKTKLDSFPKDIQPLIARASEGQMTPPRLVGNAIESYAVCKKTAVASATAKGDAKPDIRQQEFERFSRSYLQELKRAASIDYRGS
jgi:peptidyl-prolyl cis-trans isomerase SurA